MLAKALRDFPFSEDGVHAIRATAGAVVNIPDALVEGLKAEGWIAEPDPAVVLTLSEAEADLAAAQNRLDLAETDEAKGLASNEVAAAERALEAARAAAASLPPAPPPVVAKPDEPVLIPVGWADLKWFDLLALARQLGAAKNAKKDEVVSIVEAEIARRSAEA